MEEENKNFILNFNKIIENKTFDYKDFFDTNKILIQNIEKTLEEKWCLPNFQRYYDWKEKDISSLLDSIVKNYFIGSLLLLELDKDNKQLDLLKIENVKEIPKNPEKIILDGQQRLTSLYYAFNKNQKNLFFYFNFKNFFEEKNEEIIFFEREELDEKFCFENFLFPFYELKNYVNWIPQFRDFWKEKLELEKMLCLTDNLSTKLNDIYTKFEIPYICLKKEIEIEKVSSIFINLNSKGKPLGNFDLLIAILSKYDINLREVWDNELENNPYMKKYFNARGKKNEKIPLYVFQAMLLYFEKNSYCDKKFQLNIYEKLNYSDNKKFENDFKEFSKKLDYSLKCIDNLGKTGFGNLKINFLPYEGLIPVLSSLYYLEEKENTSQSEKIKNWYWSSIFTNSYSSSVDTQKTLDFKELKLWFKDDNKKPKVILKMFEKLEKNILNLREISSLNNSIYKGILAILSKKNCMDFKNKKTIDLQELNYKNEIDKDHIFSKKQYSNEKNINSILNMTLLYKKTNIEKSGKKAKCYFEKIKKEYNDDTEFFEILATHLIDKKCYKNIIEENFEDFINNREKIIIDEIKKLVGYKKWITTNLNKF